MIGEIRRRAKGEYILPPENVASLLEAGEAQVDFRYKLSALVLDFLHSEGILEDEEGELLRILGCEENDHADVVLGNILNPFPKYANNVLQKNEDVDEMYPGKNNMPKAE